LSGEMKLNAQQIALILKLLSEMKGKSSQEQKKALEKGTLDELFANLGISRETLKQATENPEKIKEFMNSPKVAAVMKMLMENGK